MENIEPCRSCGSPVTMRTVELPRRMGSTTPDTTEQRVCTNSDCTTNQPRQRRLGEAP